MINTGDNEFYRKWAKAVYNDPPQVLNEIYPPAGNVVDGRIVRTYIPNTASIRATFNVGEYEVLPGVRVVNMDLMDKDYIPTKDKRTLGLAEEIKESNEINPLIVAVDDEGPYILEGGHRYDALEILGAKSFPALVVIEGST